jgi:hypothetical protein
MEAAQETFKVSGSCASDAALESPKSVQPIQVGSANPSRFSQSKSVQPIQVGSANFEVGSANFGGKRPWASLVRNDETA